MKALLCLLLAIAIVGGAFWIHLLFWNECRLTHTYLYCLMSVR